MDDYLYERDRLLLHQFEDGMLLSELDGYLTGLIVSPDLVPQSKWLNKAWGDAPPKFNSTADMQTFLDLPMCHYNDLIEGLAHPEIYEPVSYHAPINGHLL